MAHLITFAAEAEAHSSGLPNAYAVGAAVLALLLVLLVVVVAIGGGREHS